MKNKNIAIVLFAAAIMVFLIYGGIKYTGMAVYSKEPLRMWGSEFPSNRFFYLAKEKGFFEEEGINVEIKETPDEQAVQSYVAGKLDFLHVSLDWYAILKSQGVEGEQIMIFEQCIDCEGLAVSERINSLKDLKRKKVALWEGTVLHFQFLLMLDKEGLNKEDINIISLPPNEAMIAFISGNVDAAAAYQPWLSQYKERKGAKLLYTDKDAPLLIGSSLVVSKKLLDRREKDVKAFLRAFFKAVDYWKQNPEEADEIMGKSIGISGEDFKFYMDRTHMLDYNESLKIFKDGTAEEIINKVNEIWLKEGIIKKPLTVKESINKDILETLY